MVALHLMYAALATIAPSEKAIRERLDENDLYWARNKDVCLAYGPLAYSAYRAILEDKQSTPQEVFQVLRVLSSTKGNIRPLAPQLVRCLTNEVPEIRSLATELYGRHATSADAPQFCILMFDSNRYVIFAAAEVLSKVGDRNALTAMELWQTSKSNTAHPGYRAVVKDYENALRKRLDMEDAERRKAEPPKK